ncbi:MAG: hypothetical protein C4567_09150 [Deltaproteobacteria bacterium]|nr:MAG: hypothetical protein C4567_09150 [Deltaproteobacteria bacterium]
MEQGELQKYILDQAKTEVDHTRSWPPKILAFYVTIHFGIVGAHLALTGRTPPINAPFCAKLFITLFVVGLFLWAALVLGKNHLSYLRHRNIQIHFQIENLKKYKDTLPKNWFIINEISLFVRKGWWFYLYLMFLVTILTMGGVWFVR